MSFECPHCGLKNNELQDTNTLGETGQEITLTVTNKEDLSRFIVRSKYAVTKVPELGLEIPATKKGYHSTLEGFMTSFKEDLMMNQDQRREIDPVAAEQIDNFLQKLDKYINMDEEIVPYHFVLYDPSGNSYIQNLIAPAHDPNLKIEKFNRTIDQIVEMGYNPDNVIVEHSREEADEKTREAFELLKDKHFSDVDPNKKQLYSKEEAESLFNKLREHSIKYKKYNAHKVDFSKPLEEADLNEDSAMEFAIPCHVCGLEGINRMCTCSVPYFKEIIIMAFTCDNCGARSTDVKVGGGFSEKAKKYTLKVNGEEEMNRDLFKSETAAIFIPELGLEVVEGSLGGVYSTVEGLLEKMLETLRDDNPFIGDSSDIQKTSKFEDFLNRLDDLKQGKSYPFTLIFDDPMSNCFIQNPNFPNEDIMVITEEYERTWQQNEDLGLNDIVV